MFECLILNKNDFSVLDYNRNFSSLDDIISYCMRFFKLLNADYMSFKNHKIENNKGCLFYSPSKNICIFFKNLCIPNLRISSPLFNLKTGKPQHHIIVPNDINE